MYGVLEAKQLSDNICLVAKSEQVKKYLNGYGVVLVTNFRDFLLLDTDKNGVPRNLERYTLANSEQDFWSLTSHIHQSVLEHEKLFTEFIKRVFLHKATLTTSQDVAQILASYAREARFLIEQSTMPSLLSLRNALEETVGMKFEGEKGDHLFRSTLIQTLFYGIFSAWVIWAKQQEKKNQTNESSSNYFDWHSTHW